MPPTQRRPSDDELLDAAMNVFADHGFAKASMTVIAERAGSTKPTLYAHFGSKENLFNRIIQREFSRAVANILPHYDQMADRNIDESVDTLIGIGMNYVTANPQTQKLIRISLESSADPMLSQILAINEMFTAKVAELVQRQLEPVDGAVTEDSRAIASMIIGSGLAVGQHMLADSETDPERLAARLSTFLRGGLQALTEEAANP